MELEDLELSPFDKKGGLGRLGADMCISGKPPSLRLPVMPTLNSDDTPKGTTPEALYPLVIGQKRQAA